MQTPPHSLASWLEYTPRHRIILSRVGRNASKSFTYPVTTKIGVVIGSVLIVLVACIFVCGLHAPNTKSLIPVGLVWTVLTAAVEFTFGRFLIGCSWNDLVSDYDITHGRLLAFGMALLLFAPLIASTLRGLGERTQG